MSDNNKPLAFPILTSAAMLTGMLLAPFVSATADVQPHETDGPANIAPLFADDSPLAVTIEAPLTTLMKDRPEEEYLEGKFSFTQRRWDETHGRPENSHARQISPARGAL